MSKIKDTADTEFDELHVDLGKLNLEVDIVSYTDGWDILEELLGIVSAPVDDRYTKNIQDGTPCNGRIAFRIDSCQGSSPSFSHTPTPSIYLQPGICYTNIHCNSGRLNETRRLFEHCILSNS